MQVSLFYPPEQLSITGLSPNITIQSCICFIPWHLMTPGITQGTTTNNCCCVGTPVCTSWALNSKPVRFCLGYLLGQDSSKFPQQNLTLSGSQKLRFLLRTLDSSKSPSYFQSGVQVKIFMTGFLSRNPEMNRNNEIWLDSFGQGLCSRYLHAA